MPSTRLLSSRSLLFRLAAPCAAAACLLPAAVRAAPGQAETPGRSSVVDWSRVHHDAPGDGTLWSRARSYKASFGTDGTRFIPYLGPRAPRNFPLAFRLESVVHGSDALEFDVAAEPLREGDEVRFERGGVTEIYRLATDSMEQLFVLDRAFGAGEVRLSIGFETELRASSAGAGLRFANDLGGIDYGAAVAIDAAGRRLALRTTLHEDTIEIEVPAAFAEAAAWPLTIDPLVTTFSLSTSPDDEFLADTAFNVLTSRYLVCWEIVFSASDHDVYCQLQHVGGLTVAGSGLFVDATADLWAEPSCAYNEIPSRFGIVAQVGLPASAARQIKARVRTDTILSSTLGAVITVNGGEAGDKIRPRIGGGLNISDAPFCVVWERALSPTSSDVHLRRFLADGTFPQGVQFLSDGPATHDQRPDLCHRGLGSRWQIVWQREMAPGDHDLYYADMEWSGSFVGAQLPIMATPFDDTNPRVSMRTTTLTGQAVVFERAQGAQRDVMAAAIAFPVGAPVALGSASLGADQFEPDIEVVRDRALVVWTEQVAGANFDVRCVQLHWVGSEMLPADAGVTLGGNSTPESKPRLTSTHNAASAAEEFFIVWHEDLAHAGGGNVLGARFAPATDVPTRVTCIGDGSGTPCPCGNSGASFAGCGNSVNAQGASLSSSGASVMTGDTLTLLGAGMPPNTSCLYFQGTAPAGIGGAGTVFGDGLRCASGVVIRLATKTNSGAGTSAYPTGTEAPVSVRGSLPTFGGRRWYQVWYRNAASFCTASTFNLSNGLEVIWVLQ